MCGRRSKHFSVGSGRLFRALLVSLLFVCLALQPLAAWPTKQAETQPVRAVVVEEEVSSQVQAQISSMTPTIPLTTSNSNNFSALENYVTELSNELESSKKVTADVLVMAKELGAIVTAMSEIEAKEDASRDKTVAELAEAEKSKAEVAEAYAASQASYEELKGLLKKEQSSKFFANIGLVLGFKSGVPVYGASTSIGLRIGKGMTLSVGVQYTFGTFTDIVIVKDLDRFAITGSVGWEW